MKKIAHLFNSIEYSGAERMIFTLRDFYNTGLKPYAISTGKEEGAFYSEFGKYFATCHLPVSARRNIQYVKDFFKMIRFYKKEKIDILHIHPSKRFLFHVLAAKIGGVKKIVRQVHNNFYFTGLVKLKEKLGRKIALKLGVTIIAISKSVHETEKTRFKTKTILVNNFFDEDKIYPGTENEKKVLRKALKIPENSFCIISIGSCIERKQHSHIIEMIKNVKETIPSIFYIHLGNGDLCEKEKDLASTYKLSETILFAGNQNNVRDYLVISDVYVITSAYEGIGIASIEAMGAGIASVLYDTPGSQELGEGKAPAILVKPDVISLSEKIKEIYFDPALRAKIASDSIGYAMSEYSKKRAIKEWQKIYNI